MALNQIIHELQDMTHLSWAKTRNSSGTAGSFLKAYEDGVDGKTYFKLSNYDAWKGIIGHECVNEIIVDRLLSILGMATILNQTGTMWKFRIKRIAKLDLNATDAKGGRAYAYNNIQQTCAG
jgi:hypothetical protein